MLLRAAPGIGCDGLSDMGTAAVVGHCCRGLVGPQFVVHHLEEPGPLQQGDQGTPPGVLAGQLRSCLAGGIAGQLPRDRVYGRRERKPSAVPGATCTSPACRRFFAAAEWVQARK